MTSWVLMWVFLGYSGNLETRIPFASVKEILLDSRDECERALQQQVNVNDTAYMMAHGDGQLVCVPVPVKWDVISGKILSVR